MTPYSMGSTFELDESGTPIESGDLARAMINILEDSDHERAQLQKTHRAMLNILEDFAGASDEIQHANDELIRLDDLKSEFMAMASHELRTPLTSISGFSDTMLDRWHDISEPAKFDYVKIISAQARRLTRLVENLLTLSRIESGAIKIEPTVIDVGHALLEARILLDSEGVELQCDEDVRVFADRDHFLQIIGNLLSNAVRYGSEPISISVSVERRTVRIEVADDGDGVPEAFVARLFERFAQADTDRGSSTDEGHGRGTGLGLSIVEALVDAQGGIIWYEPGTVRGSRFIVRLPRAV